ncbi:hypothetical protein V2J09_024252 [Rumex salicifolius]
MANEAASLGVEGVSGVGEAGFPSVGGAGGEEEGDGDGAFLVLSAKTTTANFSFFLQCQFKYAVQREEMEIS